MRGVALLTLAAACADEVTVATTSGRVRGAYNRSLGVYQFMGIPFAAPPVGDLRWQPPARFEPARGADRRARLREYGARVPAARPRARGDVGGLPAARGLVG